jgi:hypothetical protein
VVWLAAVLVSAALAFLLLVGVDELAFDAHAAGSARPTRAGPYLIVWARAESPGAELRCFVARTATPSRAGIWLCG